MRTTAWVVSLTTAALIGYDVYAVLCLPPGSTISEVLLGAALHYPIVPFAFGFLMGHLFWPQRAR